MTTVVEQQQADAVDDLTAKILGEWARNVDDPQGNVETLARIAAKVALRVPRRKAGQNYRQVT